MALRIPFPVAVAVAVDVLSVGIAIGNGIAIAIGIAMAIGMGIAIAIAIAIRFLAICSMSLLCRRSFNVGQLKLELSVVRHVLHFMSYGATMVLHCHSISI